MSTEIEVRNFQSIEHAQITLAGYTSIVGRSNIGKSAIVRAVKAALTGAAGTSFVRHGPDCARKLKDAKKCHCKTSVRIKREGFDLLWEKGDHHNSYTFNGTVYDSVERGTPNFLTEGYAPIKIGDDKELLQVADQFDPIFLLNRTGGVVADVLSDVAHLDRINAAMRLVERDRREALSTRKIREQDVTTLSERLEQFDGIDAAVERVKTAGDQLGVIATADRRLQQIDRFLEEGTARGIAIKNLMGVEGVVLPDPTAMRAHAEGYQLLSGWHDRLLALKAWWDRTKPVEGLAAPDSGPLRDAFEAFGKLAGLGSRYDTLSQDVERLEEAHNKILESVESIRGEWDALGVCPTCEQPCGSSHLV